MEAATAGAPAAEGEGQAQVEGQEAQEGQVEVNDWQESIDSRLNDAVDSIRQMGELVQSRLPEPQAEPSPDFEAQFADLFEQSGGYPDPTQLQGLVQQQIQSGIQEAIAPIQQQLGQFQQQMTAQELAGLQQQFPELSDQKAADALANEVVNAAVSFVPKGLPPQIAESIAEGLMQNAEFVRQVHLAGKAKGQIQQETPAGQGQTIPQIETGGGAAPTSTSEGDPWDQIAKAGRPNGPIW